MRGRMVSIIVGGVAVALSWRLGWSDLNTVHTMLPEWHVS
jgi:hypothetical protein